MMAGTVAPMRVGQHVSDFVTSYLWNSFKSGVIPCDMVRCRPLHTVVGVPGAKGRRVVMYVALEVEVVGRRGVRISNLDVVLRPSHSGTVVQRRHTHTPV